jgi:hypothetical protein
VRYTVEQGDLDSALVLSSCDTWWCEALEGYTLHIKGDVVAADSVFALALAAMPEKVHCEWNDLSSALESADLESYRGLTCRQRDSANASLFWRATPAFARGGNDVRTEWYARRTLIRSLDQAMTHHGMRNSPDYNAMVLRYGAATSLARRPEVYGSLEHEINVVGLEPKPAYPFWAARRRVNGPRTSRNRPPVSRPSSRRRWKRFGTSSSRAFVAATRSSWSAGFTARTDTLFVSDNVGASISVSAGPHARTVTARASARGGHGALGVRAVLGGIASLEGHGQHAPRLGGTTLRPGFDAGRDSDLLITVPGDSAAGVARRGDEHRLAGSADRRGRNHRTSTGRPTAPRSPIPW